MSFQGALRTLVEVAEHPLAVGLYALVVVAWLVLSLRVKRHQILLRHLQTLPEADRLKALELEMGPIPKKGIDAEQWLRARAQVFNLARWIIVAITGVIILSLVVYLQLKAGPRLVSVSGHVRLNDGPLPNGLLATLTIAGMRDQWQTDANGNFEFQIPAVAKSDSLTLIAAAHAPFLAVQRETTVAKTAATGIHLNLTTPTSHFIGGRVLEEGSGAPVRRARVSLDADRGSGETDADGHFRFLARGDSLDRVEVTVSHPRYETFHGGLVLTEGNGPVLLRARP